MDFSSLIAPKEEPESDCDDQLESTPDKGVRDPNFEIEIKFEDENFYEEDSTCEVKTQNIDEVFNTFLVNFRT